MAEESVGLSITIEDITKLSEINPLAWEQLLHIADVRVLKEKIAELEKESEERKPSFISGAKTNNHRDITEAVIA
tara:strand:+ start:3614 stop:3838 length:225 start_codon:yes stop_codon:yes gene_type:complete